MFKLTAAFLFLASSISILASPSVALAIDTYKCVSKDPDTGYSIGADLAVNGAVADIVISASGLPGCKSEPSLVVSGKRPVLTLTGALVCDGDEPEDIEMVLNTSKKTLSLGDTVFSCK